LAITNFSDNLKIVLEHARELASAEGSMSIEERHLVLSILENSKYSTAKMLENFGVDAGALRKNLEKF
jgi:ATP-dependent Clp protease ATP-binding subunit ClpA